MKKNSTTSVSIDPEKVDQTKLLETVLLEIPMIFQKDLLVKPLHLDDITVKQTVIDKNSPKDKEGNYTGTKEETSQIKSRYGKGIILKISDDYVTACNNQEIPEESRRKPGDIIYYVKAYAQPFDLYRDSVLIPPYHIVAYESNLTVTPMI